MAVMRGNITHATTQSDRFIGSVVAWEWLNRVGLMRLVLFAGHRWPAGGDRQQDAERDDDRAS